MKLNYSEKLSCCIITLKMSTTCVGIHHFKPKIMKARGNGPRPHLFHTHYPCERSVDTARKHGQYVRTLRDTRRLGSSPGQFLRHGRTYRSSTAAFGLIFIKNSTGNDWQSFSLVKAKFHYTDPTGPARTLSATRTDPTEFRRKKKSVRVRAGPVGSVSGPCSGI